MGGEWRWAAKNTVPAALQDLLVREAAFALSRKRIGEAVEVARANRDSVAAARPLLSFVRQDAKKEHREKLKEAEENVAILEAGAKKLDATIPVLHQCVERSVENYLRELDPEYVNGLSASRFSVDWQRILERFEQAVELYSTALEQLPTLLATLVPNEICGAHFDGRQLIQDTARRAKAVLGEITFINKVAEAQRLRAGGNGGITLERQPERQWGALAESLLSVQPLAAARTVKQLFAESKEVVETVHDAIRNQARQATYTGGYGVTSYHESIWTSLREAALAKLRSDQLEQILEDTERRIEVGELMEFVPEPTELPAEALAAIAAAPATGGGLRVGGAGKKAVTISMPAPVVTAPAQSHATGKSLSLKVPGRGSSAATPIPGSPLVPMTPLPSVVATAAAGTPAPLSPSAPLGEPVVVKAPATAAAAVPPVAATAAELAELRAERERLDALLNETKASLNEREQFLSESEARLMQTSQAQLEREVELEQREEQLRELERRLRELQPGLLPAVAEPAKKFDEFNE